MIVDFFFIFPILLYTSFFFKISILNERTNQLKLTAINKKNYFLRQLLTEILDLKMRHYYCHFADELQAESLAEEERYYSLYRNEVDEELYKGKSLTIAS